MIQLTIAADEPALFFTSVEAAEKALEWVDVRDGVYTALYGRAGEVYEVSEDGWRVHIKPTAAAPRPEELRELLTLFLAAIGQRPESHTSVSELLARCESYCDD